MNFVLLLSATLLASGCDWASTPGQNGSVTVELPPARPYRTAAAKPGFSQPLLLAPKS